MKIEKLTDEQVKTLFYIALAIIALVLITKAGKKALESVGLIESKESKAARTVKKEQTAQQVKELQAKSKPTRTAADWAAQADTIYNALKTSAASDDKSKAYEVLARVLTDYDMGSLIKAFGVRQEYAFGIPIGDTQTLSEFVNGNFSQKDIDDLNKLYAKSKMRFKF